MKYPKVDFGVLDKCETLTWELDAFNKFRHSLHASVGEALIAPLKRALLKSCVSEVHARALRALLAAVACCSDKQVNMEALDMSKEAVDGMQKSPAMQNTDSQCTVAEILYWRYVCQRNVTRFKQMVKL